MTTSLKGGFMSGKYFTTLRESADPLQSRLLTIKQAAEYLGVSISSVRRMIQKGEVPVVRYGPNGPNLIDIRDLDKWIERRKQADLLPVA
jgi:excisionase family DNA binding protein